MNYFAVLFLACVTFFITTNPGWAAFVMLPKFFRRCQVRQLADADRSRDTKTRRCAKHHAVFCS